MAPMISTVGDELPPAPEPPPELFERLGGGPTCQGPPRLGHATAALAQSFFRPTGRQSWSMAMITDLGLKLREFTHVFSTSPKDLGACSLLPSRSYLPEGSAPLAMHSRIVSIPFWQYKRTLSWTRNLAVGLIDLFSLSLVTVPKASGGNFITPNYKNIHKVLLLGRLPAARVDQMVNPSAKAKFPPPSTVRLHCTTSWSTKTLTILVPLTHGVVHRTAVVPAAPHTARLQFLARMVHEKSSARPSKAWNGR